MEQECAKLQGLDSYKEYFAKAIPRTPTNRYASIILLRETKSYAIFTTEGGEQQDVEQVPAGLRRSEPIHRLVMFKRKQVAPERRTGKALLRQYGIFPYAIKDSQVLYGEEAEKAEEEAKNKSKEGAEKKVKNVKLYKDCYLTEGLCTRCPDCLIYGYAAIEAEGSRKARVMTDTCFSIRSYKAIQKQIKFNVIDEADHTSGTITEYDHTTPGVFLPAVETTVDLTADEFVYVLGNILRTTRYGKEGSRQGFVRNHILAIAFSDVELFSNLEFTQALYDALVDARKDLERDPLTFPELQKHADDVIKKLTENVAGRCKLVQGQELEAILEEVRKLNQNEERLKNFLRCLHEKSALFTV
ncbi:MAG: type I-D CRISPR-associated protein Cas7/Csc2 [Thermus sp.]|uniref:type I-D CRISPR-associated protein Cas7/Csc2 n=1 Tax=Thermus sp. TaxID=275 RepID=UPI003919BA28